MVISVPEGEYEGDRREERVLWHEESWSTLSSREPRHHHLSRAERASHISTSSVWGSATGIARGPVNFCPTRHMQICSLTRHVQVCSHTEGNTLKLLASDRARHYDLHQQGMLPCRTETCVAAHPTSDVESFQPSRFQHPMSTSKYFA